MRRLLTARRVRRSGEGALDPSDRFVYGVWYERHTGSDVVRELRAFLLSDDAKNVLRACLDRGADLDQAWAAMEASVRSELQRRL